MKSILNLESQFKPPNYFVGAFQKSLLKRYWPLLLIPCALLLTEHLGYSINLTSSLPQKFWLIVFKKTPKRGDYILFKPPFKSDVPRGTLVIKQVLGIPGDRVTKINQDFFINDQIVATAKRRSLTGKELVSGPTGILGSGQYYVSTPHVNSFDSRYEKMGWIHKNQIIGVAYPLW